jgi:drug/metabolite transporter (DMT)-like permease
MTTALFSTHLWALYTLIAAASQTVRNAMQRELTQRLGTVGATHVRFLFGFPFALLFLAGVMLATGEAWPRPGLIFWPWLLLGALAQVLATALMLAAMGQRSFVVAYAYIKTEPVQVAVFGLVFLGDALSTLTVVAILVATAGVIVMSLKGEAGSDKSWRPTVMGLASGGLFALSAIGYRGGILSLGQPDYVIAATYTVTWGLFIQTAILTLYLVLREPQVIRAIGREWKPSLFAGFMGATASEFWFLAFALTTAASVRTLGLVEVLFAQLITVYVFRQRIAAREALGIALVVAGVVLLIWAY